MTYLVTGPLAVIADSTGKRRYYYQGAMVPGDLLGDELSRLIEIGLIREVDEPNSESNASEPAIVAASGDVERPAQVASKGLWVDYAVSRGMDRDKAEAMTKPELIDAYPTE